MNKLCIQPKNPKAVDEVAKDFNKLLWKPLLSMVEQLYNTTPSNLQE